MTTYALPTHTTQPITQTQEKTGFWIFVGLTNHHSTLLSIKKSVGIEILGLLVEWLKRQFTFENPQFPSESSQKCNSFCISSFCKNCNNFFASILFFSDRNTCSSSLMTQKKSYQILPLLSHPMLCRIKLSRGALYLLKMCTVSDAAMRMMLSKSLSLITVAWFQSALPQ